MSTTKAILINIIGRLRGKDIRVMSDDITEGLPRPCFYVRPGRVKSKNMGSYIEKIVPIKISFFPTDRYKNTEELLDIEEFLEKEFLGGYIEVVGDVIPIIDVTSDVVDKILHFEFSLDLIELVEKDNNAENMEEIVFREVSNDG